jgi:hypothetical protein
MDPDYGRGQADGTQVQSRQGVGKPENDQLLVNLCNEIGTIERSSQGCEFSSGYELRDPEESQRQAPVLRYIATMLLNEMKQGGRARFVIVVALLQLNNNWRFIVAMNGHQSVSNKCKLFMSKIPKSIGGIEVDALMDDSWWRVPVKFVDDRLTLQSLLSDRKLKRGGEKKYLTDRCVTEDGTVTEDFLIVNVPPLLAESVWQWHSEQKLLRYVKMAYGRQVRDSIVALGISKSPCADGDEGTNHCEEYLHRKYLKGISSGNDNSVAAYWYKRGSGGPLAPECSMKQLARRVDLK